MAFESPTFASVNSQPDTIASVNVVPVQINSRDEAFMLKKSSQQHTTHTCVCVCVCARACVRMCMRVRSVCQQERVRERVRVCVRESAHVFMNVRVYDVSCVCVISGWICVCVCVRGGPRAEGEETRTAPCLPACLSACLPAHYSPQAQTPPQRKKSNSPAVSLLRP